MTNQTLLEMLKENESANTALYKQKQIIIERLIQNGFGWQDFARAGQKLQAVKMYCKKYCNNDIAYARKVVEDFIEDSSKNNYHSHEVHGTDPLTEYANTI